MVILNSKTHSSIFCFKGNMTSTNFTNNNTAVTSYCIGKQPTSIASNFNAKLWLIEYTIPLVYGIPSVIVFICVLRVLWSTKGKKMFLGSFYTFLSWALLVVSFPLSYGYLIRSDRIRFGFERFTSTSIYGKPFLQELWLTAGTFGFN